MISLKPFYFLRRKGECLIACHTSKEVSNLFVCAKISNLGAGKKYGILTATHLCNVGPSLYFLSSYPIDI